MELQKQATQRHDVIKIQDNFPLNTHKRLPSGGVIWSTGVVYSGIRWLSISHEHVPDSMINAHSSNWTNYKQQRVHDFIRVHHGGRNLMQLLRP